MRSSEGLENASDFAGILAKINSRLSRIETVLNDTPEPTFQKDWYSVAETAEILDRAPFTVREWARLRRINALKRPSGRGKASEWMIAHREIERFQNKGLLPRGL